MKTLILPLLIALQFREREVTHRGLFEWWLHPRWHYRRYASSITDHGPTGVSMTLISNSHLTRVRVQAILDSVVSWSYQRAYTSVHKDYVKLSVARKFFPVALNCNLDLLLTTNKPQNKAYHAS